MLKRIPLRLAPRTSFVCIIAISGSLIGCTQSPPKLVQVPVAIKSNPPLTKTQSLGVDVMKTLSKDSRLSQASISVGTDASTITLDGHVPTASAKQVASQIAHKRAPTFKIINRLVVRSKQ